MVPDIAWGAALTAIAASVSGLLVDWDSGKGLASGGDDLMSPFVPYIGAAAAFLEVLSYVPQVRKVWPRVAMKDLSLSTISR